MVIFIGWNFARRQILLHPIQHYLTERLLNSFARISLRFFLRSLQLCHLSPRQLDVTILRPARPDCRHIAVVEFKAGEVFNARGIGETADSEHRGFLLHLGNLPLPGHKAITVNVHRYRGDHRDLGTFSRKGMGERIAVVELSALTGGDAYGWSKKCKWIGSRL